MKPRTSDSFFNGKICIRQSQSGYRFSIDAALLASFTRPHPGDKVLDLGTGCGVIPLILALRYPQITVCGVEVQPELADLARRNVCANQMEKQITILCRDMKSLKPEMISGVVDLAVSNPPFHRSTAGRLNPDSQRAIARHEIKASLADVIAVAKRVLRTSGRFLTIYTADRTAELIAQMRSERIEPKIIRTVHSKRDSEAKLILVEGIKEGRSGTRIYPPLILYDRSGRYTQEVQRMLNA